MSDFITKCLMGEALLEEIDDYVDSWHDGDSDLSMHEFLGMTHAEYSLWVKDPDCLPQIVIARRHQQELVEVGEGHGGLPIAARSENHGVPDNLIEWIREMGLWE